MKYARHSSLELDIHHHDAIWRRIIRMGARSIEPTETVYALGPLYLSLIMHEAQTVRIFKGYY